MGRKNGKGANTGKGEVGKVAQSVAPPTKVVAPKLPKMPAINTGKISSPGDAAAAMHLVNSVASQLHKKKKKKKSPFGKIGDFLGGALDKVFSIAPEIIHSLAGNVAEDWQQGPHNKRSLLARAKSLDARPLSLVPRLSAPVDSDGGRKVFVVSRRNANLHPTLADNLKSIGVQMTPLPNTSFSAPVAAGMRMSSSFKIAGVNHKKLGAGMRVCGVDYVDDVITNGTEARGVLKSEIDLNPAKWDGTRVARYAAMYERFEINSLSMVYTPACGTTTTGSLVGWFDYDPTDDSGQSRDTVVRAISSIGEDNSPVWASHVAHFKKDPEQFDYYVDPEGSDDRLTSAGTYRLNVLSGLSTGAGGAYGTLTMVYDVSFFVPSVQQTIPGPGPEYKAQPETSSSSAATPFGTNPTVDDDNTMELEYTVAVGGGSQWYGFQGSKSMPASYFTVYDGFGAAGMTGVTWTGGTSVTFLSGSAAASATVNAAGTHATQLTIFTVNQPLSDDPSQTWVKMTGAGGALTGGTIRFFRVPGGVQLKKMTLQDFERKTLELVDKVKTMEEKLSSISSPAESTAPSPALSRAMPSLGSAPSMLRLDKCYFCGDPAPDHVGSRCPQRRIDKGKVRVDEDDVRVLIGEKHVKIPRGCLDESTIKKLLDASSTE